MINALGGKHLITFLHISTVIILSISVNKPSEENTDVQMLAPDAITSAVTKEFPPPVIPPYKITTMGADIKIETIEIMVIDIAVFIGVLNIHFCANIPVE